jgi:hypothetical protein
MKLIPRIIFIAATFLFSLAAPAVGQEGADRFFVSTRLDANLTRMTQTTEPITPNDPVYVVFDLTKTKGTIGDLISKNPETGERNLFLCFDMYSFTAYLKPNCVGVLKQPLSEAVLMSKSYVYTLIPPTNDLNLENIDVIYATLGAVSNGGTASTDLKIAYKNMESGNTLQLSPVVDKEHWQDSRWQNYLFAIIPLQEAKKRRQQLAASASEPLPTSLLNDPAAEKEAFDEAQSAYANTHRVYRVALLDRDWGYLRNQYGVLTGRAVRVALMMKRIQGGDCEVHYTRYVVQEHIAGGQFGRVSLRWRDNPDDWKPVKCDKFIGFK